MSKSINKVILIGHVGQDPKIAILPGDKKVANFSLATNRQWKDKHGQEREDVSWHRCSVFDKLADIVESWVKKGDQLYVEGRIQYNTSEADDGKVTYWTTVIVSQLVMLGGGGPRVKSKRKGRKEQFIPRELGDRNEEDLPF